MRPPIARPIWSSGDFTATVPNRLWVADFTYVATWSGVVYVAFVIDAFSRRIVGWKADTTMRTSLVLDTLEMALWTRERAGLPAGAGLIHHHDNGSQYLSFAFTQRLVDAGVDASVGSVGDALDNALAESTIGLYKTEKIRREGPWKTLADVELATLEWVDWFNTTRLHSACGRLSPAQFEARYLPDARRGLWTSPRGPDGNDLDRKVRRLTALEVAPKLVVFRYGRRFPSAPMTHHRPPWRSTLWQRTSPALSCA